MSVGSATMFPFSFFLLFLTGLIHFIFLVQNLCGGHSWSLGPLHRNSGVSLCEMVGEFLVGRLGEHSLFPEVGGEIAVGLRDGSKGGLGKVVQGSSAAPG